MFVLKQWKSNIEMRCHVKLALALIDGTEMSKVKAAKSFQTALDLWDSFGVVDEDGSFNDEKFHEKLKSFTTAEKKKKNSDDFVTSSLEEKGESGDDESFTLIHYSLINDNGDENDESKLQRIDLLNKNKDMNVNKVMIVSSMSMLSNAVASYLQRGQIKLINNEVYLASSSSSSSSSSSCFYMCRVLVCIYI
jgi:hypothetical protein